MILKSVYTILFSLALCHSAQAIFDQNAASSGIAETYNYYRDYEPTTGRYVEADPIGLEGGLNIYSYANQNPVMFTDPLGLYIPGAHSSLAYTQAQGTCLDGKATELGNLTAGVDAQPGSQLPKNSYMHSMCAPGVVPSTCQKQTQDYVQQELQKCTLPSLANALHAIQDSFASGHRGGKEWHGMPWVEGGESWLDAGGHFMGDLLPSSSAAVATRKTILDYCERCRECRK